MATILQLVQQVCPRVGLEVVSQLTASTDRVHVEMLALCNDVAHEIATAHAWRTLQKTATYTGDGVTTSFDLPSDYGWMPNGEEVWSSTYSTPMTPILDTNIWLGMEVRDFEFGAGSWNISGGQIRIKPELATGATARHNYQDAMPVNSASGVAKAEFTADDDVFRLDDRLFRLALVYRWKSDKQLPYGQEMDDFEALKEKLVARDRGGQILRIGRGASARDANIAYPKAVT